MYQSESCYRLFCLLGTFLSVREGKILRDLEDTHGLACVITRPTRITNNTQTLIDVILANKPELFKNSLSRLFYELSAKKKTRMESSKANLPHDLFLFCFKTTTEYFLLIICVSSIHFLPHKRENLLNLPQFSRAIAFRWRATLGKWQMAN